MSNTLITYQQQDLQFKMKVINNLSTKLDNLRSYLQNPNKLDNLDNVKNSLKKKPFLRKGKSEHLDFQRFLTILLQKFFTLENIIIAQILLERYLCVSGLTGDINYELLFLIALLVGQKFQNDTEIFGIGNYVSIFGFKKKDLLYCELTFCKRLDFNLYVSKELYDFYLV